MNRFFTLLLAASCLNAVGQVPDYVPTEGLVGWFDFQSGGCDVTGQSGCFDLIQGAYVDSVFGAHGKALRLNENYAQLPANAVLNLSEFTIAFRYLFESDSRMRLWKGNPDYPDDLNFLIKGSDIPGPSGFNYSPDCSTIAEYTSNALVVDAMNIADSWVDLVISRTEGGEVQVSTRSDSFVAQQSASICLESNPIRLGHWWDADPNPSIGWVDHVGFWNRALLPAERDLLLDFSMGCTLTEACNYNPDAVIDDGTCLGCDVFAARCGQGTIWDEASQTCIPDNPSDLNYDGCVDVNDFMGHLAAFGSGCEEGVTETPWQCGDPLEYQGYDYETVQIGEQCWFAENLRAENYRNGDVIPASLSDSEWESTTSGAAAIYGEGGSSCESYSPSGGACDETWSLLEYGRLYNWFAVDDSRGVCPQTWHVPSDFEWMMMIDFLGGESTSGEHLKTIFGWYDGGNGNDLSGFSFSPSGFRDLDGNYRLAGKQGYGWSASSSAANGRSRLFNYQNDGVVPSVNTATLGASIRCIKDSE